VISKTLLSCFALIALCRSLGAVELTQPLIQLYHSFWNAKNGLTGSVLAIAQANDGYLWIGTTDGLFRFDGVEFERYQPLVGSFVANSVSCLLATPDGGLWIGYLRGGATFLKNGAVTNYSEREGFPLASVRGFARDWSGATWAAAVGGFVRLEGGRWQKVRTNWNYPDRSPTALFVDDRGTLWAADTHTITYLLNGERRFRNTQIDVEFRVASFGQLQDGRISFLDGSGAVHLIPEPVAYERIRRFDKARESNSLLIDRTESIWIARDAAGLYRMQIPRATGSKVFRIADSGTEKFSEDDGLTGRCFTILEDREGSVWVGTEGGLERFRPRNLTWRQMPADGYLFSLVVADGNEILAGTRNGAVLRVRDRKILIGSPQYTWAASKDRDGSAWFGVKDALWKWQRGHFVRVNLPDQVLRATGFPRNKDPILITSIASDRSGGIWASIAGFGEFLLKNGNWTFATIVHDHPDWAARAAYVDDSDRLWLTFGEIVVAARNGHVQTFNVKRDADIGSPNLVSGLGDQVYAGGEMGIAILLGNQFKPIRGSDGNDFGLITGIVATQHDGLWLAAGAGIVHISQHEIEQFRRRPDYRVAYELFDAMSDLPDAIQSGQGEEYSSNVVQGSDGVLWFATRKGIARIDPSKIQRNLLPPPVAIRSVVADDKTYPTSARVSLPPLTRTIGIDYTALSLLVPERVQFKCKLEGSDERWQDMGARRHISYRDLPPGGYTFRVIASNNDGVWNESGATVTLAIAPAWYQTLWFKLLAIILGLGLISLLYAFERRRYVGLLRIRFDERLEERTRLARELHDTLLQTIQGTRLAADYARERLIHVPESEGVLDRLSSWLDHAIAEGRLALNSLRGPTSANDEDLGAMLTRAAELHADNQIQKRLVVSGIARRTHPLVREEVLRIGEEAIRNACIHSGGTSLLIEVNYGLKLCLRIEDNGVGFDANTARSGKPGHYGIIGMHERANKIGARLTIGTFSPGGTILTLAVPGEVIFETSVVAWWLKILKQKILKIDPL
jgi:signal transduction histidine kinase/ligand-binding sensor domain-containing protein